jgi:CHAT domain-containing protein
MGPPPSEAHAARGLPALRHARTEVAAIAAFYENSTTLQGEGATPGALRRLADQASVIHLAAHARINRQFPLLSFLALAPGRGDDGLLYAGEIQHLPLSNARLVVLGGCETASGRLSAADGLQSLARPFLAGGATAVVGSLTAVEDE